MKHQTVTAVFPTDRWPFAAALLRALAVLWVCLILVPLGLALGALALDLLMRGAP